LKKLLQKFIVVVGRRLYGWCLQIPVQYATDLNLTQCKLHLTILHVNLKKNGQKYHSSVIIYAQL